MLEGVKNFKGNDKNYSQYIDENNIGYIYLLVWILANNKLEMRNVSIEETINLVDNNLNFVMKQILN